MSPLTPKTQPTGVIHREKQVPGSWGGCRTHQSVLHFLPSPLPVQQSQFRVGKAHFRQNRSLFEHQGLRSARDLMGHTCPCHLQLVSNQDHSLPLECLLNALLKDVLPHVGVHGRERVIQQVELTVGVHSTGQADPLPLSP